MSREKTKRLAKLLAFAALGMILAAGAFLLVNHRRAELAQTPRPEIRPVPVYTARAARGQLPVRQHYIGVIEPRVFADLSPRATGHIDSVAGDVGDEIQKGRPAAVLDPRIPGQEKEAVAAEHQGAVEALEISKKVFERRQALERKGHVSEENLDASRRQYVLDRARVKRLEHELAAKTAALAYTRLTAPFDGIITQRMKDPGDLVSPGVPVMRLENPDAGYKIIARLPQQTAARLSAGSAVRLGFQGRVQEASVDRVQPALGPGALAAIEIQVARPPFGLPSGATIGVDVVVSRPEGILVPLSCLLEQEGAYRVFVIDGKTMTARGITVSLAGKSGNRAVVKGDLPEHARLVSGNESMLIQLGRDTPIQPIDARPAAQTDSGGS